MSAVTGDGLHTSTMKRPDHTQEDLRSEHAMSWIILATVLFAMNGILNIIWGIAAISRSDFFVANAQYVFGDLKTWGWVVLGFGVLEGLAALSIMRGGQFGRWAGIGLAALGVVASLMSIQAAPFWALALVAIYVMVIYGLTVYGGKKEYVE